MAKKSKTGSNGTEKSFTCTHGKGTVEGSSCSKRKKNNICPAGHPCKRV